MKYLIIIILNRKCQLLRVLYIIKLFVFVLYSF